MIDAPDDVPVTSTRQLRLALNLYDDDPFDRTQDAIDSGRPGYWGLSDWIADQFADE